MDFGVMFFSSAGGGSGSDKYRMLLDCARFADEHGFISVWTPERHFHEFGGIFPNPAVVSAALAMVTNHIEIRAGSLISPLHHVLRIAEEWSVVDNLSSGRVAISFGAGWNVDDFIFYADRYQERHSIMYQQIETLKRLWRGDSIRECNSFGREVEVSIYPRPVQRELPIWITSSGNVSTFESAGALGANLLTHMIGQDLPTLAEKIQRYRQARAEHGFDRQTGKVSLMLHTFLAGDLDEARRQVREPFRAYLRSAISLEEKAAISGGSISGGHRIEPHQITEGMMEDLLDATFERYFESASLMGTESKCMSFLERLMDIGVDEVACLVDFGVPAEAALASLGRLAGLREAFSAERVGAETEKATSAFMEDLGWE